MKNIYVTYKNLVRLPSALAVIFALSNYSHASDETTLKARINPNNAPVLSQSPTETLSLKINNMIKNAHLPGMVLAVMHKGELKIHQAYGYSDLENKIPMHKDNIFRLFSMTKPITALATIKLMDEKGIPLSTPLQQFFPEFSTQSPIPIRSLLNHTSGMSYGFKINRIPGWQYLFSGISSSETIDEFMHTLSELPLLSEPGARWRYSYSSDVQGALIENLTHSRLHDHLYQSLFEPLKMTNTGFYVTPENLAKVVPMYSNNWFSELPNKQEFEDELTDSNTPHSGGGGLLSTAGDYMKFLQIFLEPQKFNHLVNDKLVEQMLINQLDKGIQGVPERLYANSGFGYGIGVKLKNETYLSKGSVYWAGKGGTVFWVDREHDLTVVAMMQMEGGNQALETNLVPMVYEWLNEK